jgi:hypothetical protein
MYGERLVVTVIWERLETSPNHVFQLQRAAWGAVVVVVEQQKQQLYPL